MCSLIEQLQNFVDAETCPVNEQCLPGFVAGAHDGWGRARNRVRHIIDQHPKSGLPHNAICFFRDGNKWCCVNGDFTNLHVCPAGFGATFDEALNDLYRNFSAQPTPESE